jgi:hypothetical protein
MFGRRGFGKIVTSIWVFYGMTLKLKELRGLRETWAWESRHRG